MECTLPTISQLQNNITDSETIQHSLKDSIAIKTNEENENDEDYNESLLNRQRFSESTKLLDILNMLTTQAKQALEKEIYLETILKHLLANKRTHSS